VKDGSFSPFSHILSFPRPDDAPGRSNRRSLFFPSLPVYSPSRKVGFRGKRWFQVESPDFGKPFAMRNFPSRGLSHLGISLSPFFSVEAVVFRGSRFKFPLVLFLRINVFSFLPAALLTAVFPLLHPTSNEDGFFLNERNLGALFLSCFP